MNNLIESTKFPVHRLGSPDPFIFSDSKLTFSGMDTQVFVNGKILKPVTRMKIKTKMNGEKVKGEIQMLLLEEAEEVMTELKDNVILKVEFSNEYGKTISYSFNVKITKVEIEACQDDIIITKVYKFKGVSF